ncbi:hypothetical protein ACFP5Z_19655, partial [Kocuria oceani]
TVGATAHYVNAELQRLADVEAAEERVETAQADVDAAVEAAVEAQIALDESIEVLADLRLELGDVGVDVDELEALFDAALDACAAPAADGDSDDDDSNGGTADDGDDTDGGAADGGIEVDVDRGVVVAPQSAPSTPWTPGTSPSHWVPGSSMYETNQGMNVQTAVAGTGGSAEQGSGLGLM